MQQDPRVASSKKWFDKFDQRASSAALILEDTDGSALIVKASYKLYWTFPGGFVDPNETPFDGALRETSEEVGVDVDSGTVEFVAVISRRSDYAQTYQFIFKAPLSAKEFDEVVLQASEIEDYAIVSREEVLTGNRLYGDVIYHWANEKTGYIEQTIDIQN